jgi:hypothetical protein
MNPSRSHEAVFLKGGLNGADPLNCLDSKMKKAVRKDPG